MPALRNEVAAVLALTAAALAVGSCRAPSGDPDSKRQQYGVQAHLFCESLRTELIRGPRPLTHRQLNRYLVGADAAVRSTAAGLRDARRKLGQDASSQIRAFDGRVDTVATATQTLAADAAARGVHPQRAAQRLLIGRAEEVRSGFRALRGAAQAAGLSRCGHGGDELADAVLFTTYRAQYLRIQGATFRSLRGVPFRSTDNLPRYIAASRQYLKIRNAELRRLKRLTSPPVVRAAHNRLVARFAEAIDADRQLQSALFRGSLSAISVWTGRLQRMDDRYFAAERSLRRLLDGRTAS